MRIDSLTVQGFRGFNEKSSIDFDHKLTVIYAPNSYGKTSISESFEWLIYGTTSKMEAAQSKLEYKGSYRNLHFTSEDSPFVAAIFRDDDSDVVLTSELKGQDGFQRKLGPIDEANEVDAWPFEEELEFVPKPFILQHALKYLLLASPKERFQRFAQLLGFEQLDRIHSDIISLCTKPTLPESVKRLQRSFEEIDFRIKESGTLPLLQKQFASNTATIESIYEAVLEECIQRVSDEVDNQSLPYELERIRDKRLSEVFDGRIMLDGLSADEESANTADEKWFAKVLSDKFIDKYSRLVKLGALQQIVNHKMFVDIGLTLPSTKKKTCPFCGQRLGEGEDQHIKDMHEKLVTESALADDLGEDRDEVSGIIEELKSRIHDHYSRGIAKAESFLALEPSLGEVEKIFSEKHEDSFQQVVSTAKSVSAVKGNLDTAFEGVTNKIEQVGCSIAESEEDSEIMKALGKLLLDYISEARDFSKAISENALSVREAISIFDQQLNELAGIEDLDILIDLLSNRSEVAGFLKTRRILDSLPELRQAIDDFVSEKILTVISVDLTKEVMRWYEKIKTEGDPDVHFDAFDLERTKKGKVKSRTIQIGAKSYGEELISAVSSLSESKLNALGLCMSLAVNLRGDSPFEFILIDDPIQSLDNEHSVQFVGIIRELVEVTGIQLIVLSHNKPWIEQLRKGCRSLNGRFLEITGYTKKGPHIVQVPWAPWVDRLSTVDAIIKDETAGSVQLQQAEEEIRITVCEVVAAMYMERKGIEVSSHNLNSARVSKILTECGIEPALGDRIRQTFETTDDSHHAPEDYAPVRARIQRYHSWVHELLDLQ